MQSQTVSHELQAKHIACVAIGLLSASFLGFFYNWANIACFAIFSLLGLILGLLRREYALYLAFLELTLGSFGYLIAFDAFGVKISLRMAFFVIIMGLWIYDVISRRVIPHLMRDPEDKMSWIPASAGMAKALAVFSVVWIFGIIRGYLRGYNPADIFFDANSYLYLFLLFPAISYLDTKEKLRGALRVILAGAAAEAALTIALFAIFTYSGGQNLLETVYKWIRDLRIGEITPLKNGSYRIFLQSQIYIIFALIFISAKKFFKDINFIGATQASEMEKQSFSISEPRSQYRLIPRALGTARYKHNSLLPCALGAGAYIKFLFLGVLFSGAIYLSLSRSFWVGGIAGLAVLFVLAIGMKLKIIRPAAQILSVIFIGILFANFLTPKTFLQNRFAIGQAAADTRMSQFQALLPAIAENPIFGWGFGKTLTYKSFDPRLGDSQNGVPYTTYAFELGYLDMILKFGICGFAALLCFLGAIVWRLIKKMPSEETAWALSGLAALLAIHIFTPYLNHPLGIGIIILAGTVANIEKL